MLGIVSSVSGQVTSPLSFFGWSVVLYLGVFEEARDLLVNKPERRCEYLLLA